MRWIIKNHNQENEVQDKNLEQIGSLSMEDNRGNKRNHRVQDPNHIGKYQEKMEMKMD